MEIKTCLDWTISGRISGWANAYRFDLPEGFKHLHHVSNVAVLKRYSGSIIPPPDPIEVEGLEEFEVSDILAHRRSGRRK